ncbi:phosphatase PAP2 family protein [Nocardioides campestrisoli]|uniref:phosphatase PAP2 family protein n=1 Tax=Nocardioides campestrisoli TaxID=2736757 RepID=UPI00163DAFDD|nr:phosphatase PAP2 family protein [Nocardioides campestrisoli]
MSPRTQSAPAPSATGTVPPPVVAPPRYGPTSRRARTLAMLVFLAVLVAWSVVLAPPRSTYQVFGFLFAGTVAWHIQAPWRDHLAFLRDWSLPLVLLTVYLYSRGIADDLGFATVHVTEPIEADRALFGGTLPTEALQGWLCGDPCLRTTPPAWYDVGFTTVYYTHFVVAPVIAAVLWVRNRDAWVPFMRRYLSLNMLALVIYITYPMAPPWMAALDGYLTPDIARITARGWFDLSPASGLHHQMSVVSNKVAAMPSLHAGVAILVTAYAMLRMRHGSRLVRTLRWLLPLYPLLMSFTLVYYAEHYVVDVIAGLLAVVAVLVGCHLWERRYPDGWLAARRARDTKASA